MVSFLDELPKWMNKRNKQKNLWILSFKSSKYYWKFFSALTLFAISCNHKLCQLEDRAGSKAHISLKTINQIYVCYRKVSSPVFITWSWLNCVNLHSIPLRCEFQICMIKINWKKNSKNNWVQVEWKSENNVSKSNFTMK